MTDKEIENVIDNIKALCYGQELLNEDGEPLNFVEITFEDERKNAVGVDLGTFSDFEIYIEPKSKREIELEEKLARALTEIGRLGDELAKPKIGACSYAKRKTKTVLSDSKEIELIQYYITLKNDNDKKPKVKDIAKKFNISQSYASMILDKHCVRIKGKRKQEPTDD